MAGDSETLTHPVFGVLKWDPKHSYWFTQRELPGGGRLDVQVSPHKGDLDGFLKRAADLFLWALKNERRVLREAIQAYLLDLYNDGWRQEEDPVLTAEEFEGELTWEGLDISESEIVLVEFWYSDGGRDLFGGHVIVIEMDDQLRRRSAHLG